MNLLLPMMVTGLLTSGMGAALLGSVKVPLARKLEIDEARVGGLVSLFGMTMIPVILLAGFLTDLLGKQGVLVGGTVLMALSLFVLAVAGSYRTALVSVLMLSAGWSALINVLNVLTPLSFPPPTALATNLANVFFGLGAFLTPLAVLTLMRRMPLSRSLLVVGAFVLVPTLLSAGVNFDNLVPPADEQATMGTTDSGMAVLVGDHVMWLCAFALFCYGPLEASMAAWATTYLGGRGISERAASGLLSAFWLAFMASRLVTALTLPEGREAALILASAVACSVVLAGVVWSRGRSAAVVLVIAAGVVFGPVFPTIMAVLLDHFEKPLHGRAVGMLFAVGGVGWTVIPILIGAYAKRTSLERGFLVALASAGGLCVVAGLLYVAI